MAKGAFPASVLNKTQPSMPCPSIRYRPKSGSLLPGEAGHGFFGIVCLYRRNLDDGGSAGIRFLISR
ncbi:MAG TPA: hypothetical protein DIT64_01115 [Verrucomicrobiales bacterium]|nr:hypothetical protein [Verrucomicrobiales bacterium]HCN78842.1 hypothetical protein [Verrucomicrobiales bacterium]